jgi:2-(1,2-epoxy-1,2-dihydrophenyl)acetyl-CoA isomerase
MYKNILTEINGRIAVITINRPEFANAINGDTVMEITDAVNTFGKDASVGSVVITGAGKHFSAGGDINRFKMLIETEQFLQTENIANADRMASAIRNCSKPVIAMINGVATGAGLSLALACDFRIVSPSSKMSMGFVNMGLPGDTGGR